MLEVGYDQCIADENGDGVNETWYILNNLTSCTHYDHNNTTIKYYFEDCSDTGDYYWTSDVSAQVANEIKNAYANSMKKWNNVYFYSYDSYGNVVKNKIINIVEGTATDHNLSIYPANDVNGFAVTSSGQSQNIESGNISHKHNSEWYMFVNVPSFHSDESGEQELVDFLRENVGAHEFGHVLGLRDIDMYCDSNNTSDHHHELIMGYGSPCETRTTDISYKDIAGVAITRGFHTDADHKWLNCGKQSNGKYKLLCSICNGVKEVSNLSGYAYNTYNACGNNHSLSSENMMAVASYGTKDYYKCKYCKYVAPFSNIVNQNYTVTSENNTQHKYVNDVLGLEYTFYENHSMNNNTCTICNYHVHTYTDHYVNYSNSQHKSYCSCGDYMLSSHSVKQGSFPSTGGYATCLLCKGKVFMGTFNSLFTKNIPHSANGSYILQNGVVVLVDEDVEAYMDGTLIFYTGEVQ